MGSVRACRWGRSGWCRRRLRLVNGVLTYRVSGRRDPGAGVTLTMTKPQLLALLGGRGLGGVAVEGDASLLTVLLGVLDKPDPDFAIVTP
ncbi:alkyl sulfatase C-terminal domain-containing protein [Streptomyces sp. NPDC015346]|uniref:alkyl sulfatase C-terminal domain-containing protein n=1 Tax=Streptomyces sp. NPDC015346 TaxID=3364954 RepID=UPI0036F4C89C